jgi:hypothetical protein
LKTVLSLFVLLISAPLLSQDNPNKIKGFYVNTSHETYEEFYFDGEGGVFIDFYGSESIRDYFFVKDTLIVYDQEIMAFLFKDQKLYGLTPNIDSNIWSFKDSSHPVFSKKMHFKTPAHRWMFSQSALDYYKLTGGIQEDLVSKDPKLMDKELFKQCRDGFSRACMVLAGLEMTKDFVQFKSENKRGTIPFNENIKLYIQKAIISGDIEGYRNLAEYYYYLGDQGQAMNFYRLGKENGCSYCEIVYLQYVNHKQ